MSKQTPDLRDLRSATPKGTSEARRRLLRGAAIGTPVVLTLLSRPVLGQTNLCQSPSRALSGNLSQPGATLPVCDGRTISYYSAPGHAPIKTTQTLFSALFPRGSYSGSYFNDRTVAEVLEIKGATVDQRVAQAFTAALFNIRGGFVSASVLTETALRAIWTEYSNRNGTYQPFAGGPIWRGSDLLSYFGRSGVVPDALG